MKIILQRICWNTMYWKAPTWSSENFEKGYKAENGYGHEEWNFQLHDQYRGYIYPYMYKKPNIPFGEAFKIVFFALHPEQKKYVIVGVHNECYLLEDEDYPQILDFYKKSGILNRRARELYTSVSGSFPITLEKAKKVVFSGFDEQIIKIKSKADAVEIYDPPRFIQKPKNERFSNFTYLDALPDEILIKEGSCKQQEDSYLRFSPEKLAEIVPRHNIVSNEFVAYLKKMGIVAHQERENIDIQFELNGESFIVEIKITLYSTTRHAIRDSVGQILEYNYYPKRKVRDNWVILLDSEPSNMDIQYIKSLRKKLKLPIYIGWKSNKMFVFDEDILGVIR